MKYQIGYTQAYNEINTVHDILYDYNLKHTGKTRQEGVKAEVCNTTEALVVRSEDNRICGGLVWRTLTEPERYVRVDLFVIGEELRGQGMGEKVFNEFITRAKSAGARYVKLYTNTFQAPGFYQKMGMEIESTKAAPLPDVPHNEHIDLIKYL